MITIVYNIKRFAKFGIFLNLNDLMGNLKNAKTITEKYENGTLVEYELVFENESGLAFDIFYLFGKLSVSP
jgi:hypothetical protein